MKITTNTAALSIYRQVEGVNSNLSKSSKKLSTGYKFSNAVDDGVGTGLYERMDSTVRALNVAVENAQAGLGYYTAGDSALQEMSDTLKEMKDIEVRAANGTYSTSDKATMSAQLLDLWSHMHTMEDATYNNSKLIDGSLSASLQVGDTGSDTFTVSIASATASALGLTAASKFTIGDTATAINNINSALVTLNSVRAKLGSQSNELQATIDRLNVSIDNYTSTNSNLRDTDVAQEMVKYTSLQIIQQAGMALLAQANTRPQSILNLFA